MHSPCHLPLLMSNDNCLFLEISHNVKAIFLRWMHVFQIKALSDILHVLIDVRVYFASACVTTVQPRFRLEYRSRMSVV